jgi:type IV secretory pathway TrbD component
MRDPHDVPGFLAPLRQALTQPILFGGAPRSFAILNGTLAMVVIFSGALLAGLVLGVVGHLVGVFLARRDSQAMDVLQRGMRIPPRLEV